MPPRRKSNCCPQNGEGFKSMMKKTKRFLKKSRITSKTAKMLAPFAGKYADEVKELGDVAHQLGLGGRGMIIIPPKRKAIRGAIKRAVHKPKPTARKCAPGKKGKKCRKAVKKYNL